MRPTSLAFAFGLCLSFAAFAGCGGSVTGGDLMGSGGSGAAGSGGTAGSAGSGGSGATAGQGGSGGGHACGPTTCPAGQQCCNPGCGMCAPMGAVCAQFDCAPVDAGPPVPCGKSTCAPGEYCCNADCGLCEPKGAACPQVDCLADAGPPPMPCGNTTCASGSICCNVCGTDSCVAGDTCPTGGACAVDCSPQDAHGYGKCKMLFGYRWTGLDCQQVGGCSCQGTDCGNLFKDLQSCQQAYASCPQYYN